MTLGWTRMSLSEGTILDGRYRVVRPLGEGGMGAAYLVEDKRLGRHCVAKESTVHDRAHREQFEVEARVLASLTHPNIPMVYDYFFQDDAPCLIMQLVNGATLDRLKEDRSTPFDVDTVLRWASDLLSALDYLHSQQPPIIHRDVKPSNVCITPEHEAMLLDFGIARRLDETGTRTAAQAQSLHYAPIEQYGDVSASYGRIKECIDDLREEGIRSGTYSDVYSLAATLYFALTLLDPPDACLRYLGETMCPVRERNPDVPQFVVQALARALAIDPRERCQTAAEFLEVLQPSSREPEVPVSLERRRRRALPRRDIRVLTHDLVYVAGGEFNMGSADRRLKEACRPVHRVSLGAYCIGRHPVTQSEYQRFVVDNAGYPVPHSPMRYTQRYNWDARTRAFPAGLEDHPVVLVGWHDALAYCRWLSEVSGYRCRLPTEAEWEKAARWDQVTGEARPYPWGDVFDEALCNVDAHGGLRLGTSVVGGHSPEGDSSYGLSDMAGNVWEWTGSLYSPYPYVADDGREDPGAEGNRVVRGGAYDSEPLLAFSAWRNGVRPNLVAPNLGFRVACDAR